MLPLSDDTEQLLDGFELLRSGLMSGAGFGLPMPSRRLATGTFWDIFMGLCAPTGEQFYTITKESPNRPRLMSVPFFGHFSYLPPNLGLFAISFHFETASTQPHYIQIQFCEASERRCGWNFLNLRHPQVKWVNQNGDLRAVTTCVLSKFNWLPYKCGKFYTFWRNVARIFLWKCINLPGSDGKLVKIA